jgi:hypothetical protein
MFIHVLSVCVLLSAGCSSRPHIIHARQTAPESQTGQKSSSSAQPQQLDAFDSLFTPAEEALDAGHFDDAVRLFDSLRVTYPQKPQPYFYLALIDISFERWTAAKERLLAALDRTSADPTTRSRIYANLGLVWERMGNSGQAKLTSEIALAGLERLE